MNIGLRLRTARAKKGLTLMEAARRSGVTRQTISFVERGYEMPQDTTLAALARVYDLPIDELLALADAEAAAPKAEAPEGEAPGRHQVRTSKSHTRPFTGSSSRTVRDVLEDVAAGKLTVEEAERELELIGA
jgi:transcriptional regulator with XRE-family HTH domain